MKVGAAAAKRVCYPDKTKCGSGSKDGETVTTVDCLLDDGDSCAWPAAQVTEGVAKDDTAGTGGKFRRAKCDETDHCCGKLGEAAAEICKLKTTDTFVCSDNGRKLAVGAAIAAAFMLI